MRKIIKLLAMFLTCLQAQAAGFDCTKPNDIFERFVICSEDIRGEFIDDETRRKLVELDSELNLAYKAALKKHYDPMLLKQEQRAWIKARNWYFLPDKKIPRIDFKPGLVLTLYQNRISDLRYGVSHSPKTKSERKSAKILSMASPLGVGYSMSPNRFDFGYGLGICEALVRWANHVGKDKKLNSQKYTVLSMPGVSEPNWKQLEMSKNIELFKQIYRVWQRNAPPEELEKGMKKGIDDAFSGKYTMRVMNVELRQTVEDSIKESETILSLDYCKGKESCQEETSTWEVDRNLTKLVGSHSPYYSLIGHGPGTILIQFKGQPYFVHLGYKSFGVDGVYRYSDRGWEVRNFCSIASN